jgi:hypothetical protein
MKGARIERLITKLSISTEINGFAIKRKAHIRPRPVLVNKENIRLSSSF